MIAIPLRHLLIGLLCSRFRPCLAPDYRARPGTRRSALGSKRSPHLPWGCVVPVAATAVVNMAI